MHRSYDAEPRGVALLEPVEWLAALRASSFSIPNCTVDPFDAAWDFVLILF